MKKETVTLYAADQKVWGADVPETYYFETIKERNAFVRVHDYACVGTNIKLTNKQYAFWKKTGRFLSEIELMDITLEEIRG